MCLPRPNQRVSQDHSIGTFQCTRLAFETIHHLILLLMQESNLSAHPRGNCGFHLILLNGYRVCKQTDFGGVRNRHISKEHPTSIFCCLQGSIRKAFASPRVRGMATNENSCGVGMRWQLPNNARRFRIE